MSRSPQAESTHKPRLIVISAPSGAGKTTLCKMLLSEFPQIVQSVSTTTRPPRPDEKSGVDYHFVSTEDFQKKIDRDDFVEWAEVHGHRYGTEKSTIDRALKNHFHVLFSIDVQGAVSLQKIYKDRVVSIFIMPPSMEELRKRLTLRQSDSSDTIERRLQHAYNEVAWRNRFTHQITNDDLDKAYGQLRSIVVRECL